MARGKAGSKGVAGPGAQSKRSDLGPVGQPLRVATGGAYGERQAMEAQQRGAPLASPAGTPSSLPAQGPAGGGAPASPPSVFGPSTAPAEDPLAGAGLTSVLPEDPDMLLRMMYRINPNPYLLRLLQNR